MFIILRIGIFGFQLYPYVLFKIFFSRVPSEREADGLCKLLTQSLWMISPQLLHRTAYCVHSTYKFFILTVYTVHRAAHCVHSKCREFGYILA